MSRPRVRKLKFGDPASTEPTNRLNAVTSLKNGSSVRPAKNEIPLARSVVTTGVGATSAVGEEPVVGAVNVVSRSEPCSRRTIVAVCALER